MIARLLAALAVLVLTAACASTGAAPRPFPTPGGSRSGSPPAGGVASAVVDDALTLRGAPYRDGGADPSGFDCSGFVQYVFGRHALLLPRTVSDQAREGRAVRRQEIRAGDLVFFSTTAPGPSHVGIVIGPDAFVHAPSSRGVVRVERLSSSYWAPRLVAVRRVLP